MGFFMGAGGAAAAVDDTGYLRGLVLSNDTDADHDIAIAVGKARDAGDAATITLSSILTKQIDATWAAGDDAGGMNDAETVGNATWYHVHLLSGGAATDAGFDTSVTAANLLADTAVVTAGHTQYRRIGSVLTDGSANILAFTQTGDEFIWAAPVQDVDHANPGTSAVSGTLSTPVGVVVNARISSKTADTTPSTTSYWWISPLVATDATPALGGPFTMQTTTDKERAEVVMFVLTNTASQIRYRTSSSTSDHRIWINTDGWIDPRGRY